MPAKAGFCREQSSIWDARHRTPLATYPNPLRELHDIHRAISIWSCSKWGLPQAHCYQ